MPAELRKRSAPAPAPPPAKKSKSTIQTTLKADEAETPAGTAPAAETTVPPPALKTGPPKAGSTIALETFAGEVLTHDGEKVTLAKLVEASKSGVVLFTYPKASTPGCTNQARLFRDSHTPLTATGLSIYGLSADSPKANTNFRSKQDLPYTLLCDPELSLVSAIGLKKAPRGTTRGVFVVDKRGGVLAAEAGGPAATVEVVKKIVESMGAGGGEGGAEEVEERVVAETAAEVADTAAEVDGSKSGTPELA